MEAEVVYRSSHAPLQKGLASALGVGFNLNMGRSTPSGAPANLARDLSLLTFPTGWQVRQRSLCPHSMPKHPDPTSQSRQTTVAAMGLWEAASSDCQMAQELREEGIIPGLLAEPAAHPC